MSWKNSQVTHHNSKLDCPTCLTFFLAGYRSGEEIINAHTEHSVNKTFSL
jgi:hypothetical protein